MKYFLGIDGGGTKTEAELVDESGAVVGKGMAGPTSLTATNVGAASFNLREAIRQAFDSLGQDAVVESMVMGLAGVDTKRELASAEQVFRGAVSDYAINQFYLVNDVVIALESGTQSPNAVALISGTGSNCWGRNQEGQSAKTGGMDFLISDEGSGYAVGLEVLRVAVQSFDGRVPKSLLEQLVCEKFHISTITELKDQVYNPLMTKTEVAECSRLCTMAFEQGDEQAARIFAHAAAELSSMVLTVIERLEMATRYVDCVLVGAMTELDPIYFPLSRDLTAACPEMRIIRSDKRPVYGALQLAKRAEPIVVTGVQ